ncbi:hypothetical protein DFJ74DRAFT_766588 [Hyaloraphidium curvatum]|nr:hypothetical protein DFJ74DRAFT_766588 [Hyaloraphidium curvatum]
MTDGANAAAVLAHAVAPKGSALAAVVGETPVQDALFPRLPPDALFRLARASKLMHAVVSAYAVRAFDPDPAIARFFADPARFRRVLGKARAAVSGSFPLQILGRVMYPGSDMDIYVHASGAVDLCAFMLAEEGYAYQAEAEELARAKGNPLEALRRRLSNIEHEIESGLGREAWETYFGHFALLHFQRTAPAGELTVQIIVCRGSPFASIMRFHSTCVMNILTHRHLFSLYPSTTFSRLAALELVHPALRTARQRELHAAAIRKATRMPGSSRWGRGRSGTG